MKVMGVPHAARERLRDYGRSGITLSFLPQVFGQIGLRAVQHSLTENLRVPLKKMGLGMHSRHYMTANRMLKCKGRITRTCA